MTDKFKNLREARHLGDGEIGIGDIKSLLAERDALLEALKDLMADISGGEKSCGHDFTCVCAGDKARAAIAKAQEQQK